MKYILALDQGTSSSRAVLFDQAGKAITSAQHALRSIYPRPGWVEQDPEEIWQSQIEAAQEALSKSRINPIDLAAIGITNQRETCIVWEKSTRRPVYNAIVWQCRRTASYCEQLKRDGHAPAFLAKTGLVLDAYFSATKLKWILDHVPDARAKADNGELCFGTVDSWLIYKLSEGTVHATDVSNASRTLLFNLHTLHWDKEILSLFQIPHALLPSIKDSKDDFGQSTTEYFGRSVPIRGNAGDQQAALFGHTAFQAGQGKNTYGTGCFLLMNIGPKVILSRSGLLTSVAWKVATQPTYAMEGSVFIAGAAVRWLRDGLGIIKHVDETEKVAAEVSSSEGVYVVPAFVGLGAPHWDMYARGTIQGLTQGTLRAHIVRATLESIAYQTRDVLEAMESDTGIHLDELRVDGGAAQNNLLMQIQSNIIGRPVVRPANTETTAQGAAYLAGLGVGLWKSTEDLKRFKTQTQTFLPQIGESQREEMYAGWKKAVERTGSR